MSTFEEQIEQLSPKRLALLALELRRRLDDVESRGREPIAIIGVGCRLPGGVSDLESYWRLLHDGVDAVTEVPLSRFDVGALYDPDPDVPGKLSTRFGAFLDDVESFDPQFFGMAPREAAAVDPQHRLLLEVAWEALEHAAQPADALAGTAGGVFVGISGNDQHELAVGDDRAVDAYSAAGAAHSVASGRLAYTLGLQGPALSVDTACSASLVAVHLAVRSLRAGECRIALAGGVNVILAPRTTIALSKAHMMAPDGRCKAFDARADGFVRGEGCALVVLKRLSDAVADGDPILAVVLGSAVNQDGRSAGLSAPNGPSQEAVIRAALADAGADPADLTYVEAHGTGTALGDPIEVQALGSALCRTRTHPLWIGSVKTNIGHLEAAAGVAGLVKAALALEHQTIPPHLHLEQRSPHIAWDSYPTLDIPTEPVAWPEGAGALAGVSSFGFSGTNAHVVLGPAPVREELVHGPERPRHVLALSAHTPEALADVTRRMADRLEGAEDFADVCYTAGARRAHHARRLAVVAATAAEARERLLVGARGGEADGVARGDVAAGPRGGTAFLFTGQGAQHAGMGRELFEKQPAFRAALERCDALLRPWLERPLLDVLYGAGGELLQETAYAQPALVAVEVALADLWRSWGVRPTAVLGHSVGEIAAACVAGALSLEDALRLAAVRGQLMQATPDGAMAAVFAGEDRVRDALAPYLGRLDLAALNGPSSVTIAGDPAALDEVMAALADEGVASRRLAVSRAFHSPLIEPVVAGIEAAAAAVTWSAPELTVVSNLTGRPATGPELADPGYWRRHAREPVRYHEGVRALLELGVRTFLEAGPAPTLLGMAQRALDSDAGGVTWLPSLRPGVGDWESILPSLAAAYAAGADVDWKAFDAGYARRPTALPAHPFRRDRYPVSRTARTAGAAARLPLLGSRVRAAVAETVFETELGADRFPFLAEHAVHGATIVPSPAYVELAFAAALEASGHEAAGLDDLVVHRALVVPPGERRVVQTVLAPSQPAEIRVVAAADEGWTLHATARVAETGEGPARREPVETLRARIADEVGLESFTAGLASLGLELGPRFRAAERIWSAPGEALGELAVPAALATDRDPYRVHPALLDSCLHLLAAAVPGGLADVSDPYLLVAVDRLRVHRSPTRRFLCHAQLREPFDARAESISGDVALLEEDGEPIAELTGVRLKRAPASALLPSADGLSRLLHEIAWRPSPRARRPAARELVESLQPLGSDLASRHGLDVYDSLLPALDAVCAGFAARALERLGLELTPGSSFETGGLAERLGVETRHERLLGRLLDILLEDGVLARAAGRMEVLRAPDAGDPAPRLERLRSEAHACEGELAMLARTAPSLAEAMRGEADPLELLFPGGSLDAAERLYGDAPAARAYGALVAEAVMGAVDPDTGRGPLRVLEIGAGTGGSTAHILERLAGRPFEYTFTDVSPLFTSRAATRFGERPELRYAVLDIEDDPAVQGFAPGSYDVVVCANVLHALPDLRVALGHVRRLLAPGGLLVLQEATGKERFGDLTVGLTEGWWAFADDVREDYALLPVAAWLDLLATEGFVAPDALGGTPADGTLARQAVVVARAPVGPPEAVVVVGEGSGLGVALAERLAAEAIPAALLRPGGAPLSDEVRDVLRSTGGGTLVHLVSLDVVRAGEPGPAELEQQQRAGLGSALDAVQGALAAGVPCRLVLVTCGAQPANAPVTQALQAAVWGLGRVVSLEHPELRCTRVDLDPAGDQQTSLDQLATELLEPDTAEAEIAFRAGERLVARLARATVSDGVPCELRGDAAYVVTGGLGGLGLACAERLADLGAGALVLAGRRPPSAAASEAIARLEQSGVQVRVVQADVSVPEDAARIVAEATAIAPLAGVVHAAGVLDDAALLAQTWERFERVGAPKIAGTYWLEQALGSIPLDFFCLFSSGAGVLGSPGQANHAAANAFLDAHASWRQASGRPAVSIAWGPWAEIGAAADRGHAGAAISPADGLAAFELALRRDASSGLHVRAQLVVLPLVPVAAVSGPVPSLLAELVDGGSHPARAAAASRASAPAPDIPGLLASAPPGRALRLLEERVRTEAAAVLGLGVDGVGDPERPLSELGLDSLMAVELRNRLVAAAGRDLPATLLFEYPTVASLAVFLAAELGNGVAEVAGQATTERLDDLSETEVAALLERKLDAITGGRH